MEGPLAAKRLVPAITVLLAGLTASASTAQSGSLKTAAKFPNAAQTITIRMLNGKSGKPLANKNVTFIWSPHWSPAGSVVHLGKDGTGTVEVPSGSELFRVMGGPKVGKEPGRIPFIECNAPIMEEIKIAQVLKDGYVPGNTCSKHSAAPRPGEIVFWAMPIPWWQPDMQ